MCLLTSWHSTRNQCYCICAHLDSAPSSMSYTQHHIWWTYWWLKLHCGWHYWGYLDTICHDVISDSLCGTHIEANLSYMCSNQSRRNREKTSHSASIILIFNPLLNMNLNNGIIFYGVRNKEACIFRCRMLLLQEKSVFHYCYFLYM